MSPGTSSRANTTASCTPGCSANAASTSPSSRRKPRTVTGPSGDYWEIYLSKTALPAWKEGRSGGVDLTGNPRIDLLMLPVAVLAFQRPESQATQHEVQWLAVSRVGIDEIWVQRYERAGKEVVVGIFQMGTKPKQKREDSPEQLKLAS